MNDHHDRKKRSRGVAEPVQVYLEPAHRERLERLTRRLGATKSDVFRRALGALDAQTAPAPPGAAVRVSLPTFAGLGLLPGVDLDDSAALLDLMNGEDPTATR